MRFGFELEVSQGAAACLRQLRADGLTDYERLHAYHCSCGKCQPENMLDNGLIFKAQEDCTCNGEFITAPLEFGSVEADRAFVGISRALLLSGASVSGTVGNHVHVERADFDNEATRRLHRIFMRYQDALGEIAMANRDRVRPYNQRNEASDIWRDHDVTHARRYDGTVQSSGSWLMEKSYTNEFRLWNATKMEWRIRTHVGLSVAMSEAALAGVDVTRNDPRVLEDVIGPFMDSHTWAGVLRQRFSKGGISVAA